MSSSRRNGRAVSRKRRVAGRRHVWVKKGKRLVLFSCSFSRVPVRTCLASLVPFLKQCNHLHPTTKRHGYDSMMFTTFTSLPSSPGKLAGLLFLKWNKNIRSSHVFTCLHQSIRRLFTAFPPRLSRLGLSCNSSTLPTSTGSPVSVSLSWFQEDPRLGT